MRELQNVTIEITSKCNFYCKHCGNDSRCLDDNNLTKEEIFNIIDQSSKLGVQRLGITGGEPFCDDNLFEYLRYAKGKIPTIAIATNGYFIDEKVVKKLIENNVYKIAVSLDGIEEYHNTFRKNDRAFARAIKAIKLLVSAGMEVKVRSVLVKDNEDSILKLMEITNNLYVKRHEILPACPIGRTNREMILTYKKYREFLIKAVNKINSLNPRNITYQLKPVFYQEDLFAKAPLDCRMKSLSYKCDALDTSLEVSYNGDVLGCSFVRIPIGNIRQKTISEMWNCKEALELYNQLMNHNKIGECAECLDNDKCNGGCYANKLYGDGVSKKDIYCFVKRRRLDV